ncbi:hypothetical protein [Bradyrhizobium sp. CCBAU 45384]|uniref:hypothetical protein n=1 Tax=Bradyrhizobium sp. CCBAU 45384 TaxID=858428 RepID=UPI002305B7BF|nr:hypothetical protein [Bradyrhizobium sp. CCBAU 45384]
MNYFKGHAGSWPSISPMSAPDERPSEDARKSKPSRVDEARRVIEGYANDLREIIKQLRRLD